MHGRGRIFLFPGRFWRKNRLAGAIKQFCRIVLAKDSQPGLVFVHASIAFIRAATTVNQVDTIFSDYCRWSGFDYIGVELTWAPRQNRLVSGVAPFYAID